MATVRDTMLFAQSKQHRLSGGLTVRNSTMNQRTPLIGGNWKMNTNRHSAAELAHAVTNAAPDVINQCKIALFPPFTYLDTVQQVVGDSGVLLGAQDVYPGENGAFTGEISTSMLVDMGVRMVLVGHSERRHVIGEDDGLINRKLRAALDAGLDVVLCVGETLQQRDADQTEQIVLSQLIAGLDGVDAQAMARVVIAYEPVWAIGTGRTARPEDAQNVHRAIRIAVQSRYDDTIADSLIIQYGGSVKGNNAQSLFAQPDIDGGLIGGASLDAAEFMTIVRAAAECAAATSS